MQTLGDVFWLMSERPRLGMVTEATVPAVRAFLELHAETSMFLLSSLATLGPVLGNDLNSGNYRYIEENGKICAVFCLSRRGNLLAQAGRRIDLAPIIVRACQDEPFSIQGVLGEWQLAEAIWQRLCADPLFVPTSVSKEFLYRLPLSAYVLGAVTPPAHTRALAAQDFGDWEPLNTAYLIEEGLPAQGSSAQRQALFTADASAGRWWGAFSSQHLVTVAGLNAVYGSMGQVGGVFTAPECRRRGLARAVMMLLLQDSARRHRLRTMILFTGDRNNAARALYESLGFTQMGYFGLLFGSRSGAPRRL